MSTGMTVRRGEPGDVGWIVPLERQTKEAPHWGQARYLEMVGEGAAGALQRVLLVATDGNEPVGYAVGTVLLGEAELESVVVDPRSRRHGVGRLLCEGLAAWARELGAVEMRLEVRAGNSTAQALYRGVGFEETGRRRGYYAQPPEDAVLMTVAL